MALDLAHPVIGHVVMVIRVVRMAPTVVEQMDTAIRMTADLIVPLPHAVITLTRNVPLAIGT